MTTSMMMTTTKIWIAFIVFIEMTEIVSSDTNVALNASVTLYPQPSMPFVGDLAPYATDGKPSTRATTGSISSAYISIDLGRRFQVAKVLVTTPDADIASCQFGFSVGLTNTKPTGPDANASNEVICYTYIGPPIVPATEYTAPCSVNVPLYQFVVYSIPPTFCRASAKELAVSAVGTRISTYKANVGQRLMVGGSISIVPRVECVMLCERLLSACHSFNYRPSDSSCELNSPAAGSSPSSTSDPSWDWWLPSRETFNL